MAEIINFIERRALIIDRRGADRRIGERRTKDTISILQKKRVTLYLSRASIAQLEGLWLKLRSQEHRKEINKSTIIEIFLKKIIAQLEGKSVQEILDSLREPVKGNIPETQEVQTCEPQEQAVKFKQTLLYILNKVGGKPNVGQTVLYKLLYFIDFDYYEKYREPIIGIQFIKNNYGPTPVTFAKIISELERDGLIETIKSKFYQHEQIKYLINPSINLDIAALSSRELEHVDWEIDRLGNMTATDISALSHADPPWQLAEEKGVLNYEHVFSRTTEIAVKH